MNQVDQAIKLSTSYDIDHVRRHFLIEEANEEEILHEPLFEQFDKDDEYLMEIAVNRI